MPQPRTSVARSPETGLRCRLLRTIRVRRKPGSTSQALLVAGNLVLPCVIGPAGLVRRKREGDGGTPFGVYPVTGGLYRADRAARPSTRLPLRQTRRDDGWCDAPADANYNRPVRLPFPASHERLWREDRLYDLVLVIDYNQSRPRKGLGSAIFLHLMAPSASPTAGCVALRPGDLRRLLPRLAPGCRIAIG